LYDKAIVKGADRKQKITDTIQQEALNEKIG